MSLKITHKYSTAAGTPPASGDIDVGELAINAADAALYVKDTNGNIKNPANSATFTQSGTGAVQRTVEAKLKDVVSVKDFGAVGDGVTNDTAAINLAVASGKSLQWPQGTYRITSSIVCTTSQTWTAIGEVTILYDAAAGSAAIAALDFRGEIHMSGDFIVNHQANTKNFVTPSASLYNGDVITGSAVLVQADYSTIENIKVVNAWDNGIAVVKIDPTTGATTPGSPKYVVIDGVRTNNCGCGTHVSPPAMQNGKIGAGIDIGSGSACLVSNCVDYSSYNGFILDLGAGGQCQFSNCTAWYTQVDGANPTAGSGWGFYVGSGDSTFSNCYSVGAGVGGFWYDGTAQNCDFTNCAAYIPAQIGLRIKGPKAIFNGFRVKDASFSAANTYPAIVIDSSANAIDNLQLEVQVTGSSQKYGLQTEGANTIDARIEGILIGTTANVNKIVTSGSHDLGLFLVDPTTSNKATYGGSAFGFEHEFTGKVRISPTAANESSISNPFGDGPNGTYFIDDFANPSKKGAFGYDPVNDGFVIQAMHENVAKKPLLLNPSGGQVMLGKGEWTDAVRLGSNYLWVDAGGKLRIKNGAPASDTDGTVVGTQT